MASNLSIRNLLQRRLLRYFSGPSLVRGQEYYANGAVMAVRIGPSGATAEVIGTEIYQVSLDWTQALSGRIKAHCTCPHFAAGSMCKHLWAFVLRLDQMREPSGLIPRRQLELVVGRKIEILETQPAAAVAPSQPEKTVKVPGLTNWRQSFQASRKFKGKPAMGDRQELFMVLEANDQADASVKIRFFSADCDANGILEYPRTLTLPQSGDLRLSDLKLQALLKAVAALSVSEPARHNRFRRTQYFYADPSVRTLELSSIRAVLPALLQSGRVFASKDDFIKAKQGNEDLSLKLASFDGVSLKVTQQESGALLSAMVGVTKGDGPTAPPTLVAAKDLRVIAEPGFFRLGRHVGFIDMTEPEQAWFEDLAEAEVTVPPEDQEPFLEALLNQKVKFELPAELNWAVVEIEPSARLELTTGVGPGPGRGRYLVDLKFKYGSRAVSYWNSIAQLPSIEDRLVYARNRVVEERVFATLPHPLLLQRREGEIPQLPSQHLAEFVMRALAVGVPVVVENKKLQIADDFKIGVSSGVDWFDVDGQADFGGRWVKFPAILEAIRKGENFVPLPDGSLGLINQQMAERLEKLATFSHQGQESLRFTSAQGLILNSLLETETNLNLDAGFKSLREKIKSFSGIKARDPVIGFKGKLRQYQREGLGWLEFIDGFGLGGILADDMGLGKTIQCLAFIEGRRVKRKDHHPSLLLAPKSLLENWQMEAGKFTPGIDVLIYAGGNRKGSEALFKNHDLVITTYQTMLRDIELFKKIHWDCLIADEAQAIKNPEALISRAAKVLSADFRLAMTGTPIENSIQDLFSISDFVNPGFLRGKGASTSLKLSDEVHETLAKAFRPVVLRRTKDQVLKDLPGKTEQMISVELESKQLKVYNELKRFYQGQLMKEIQEKGIKKSQIQILAALTRLRQVALHPGLVDPNLVSAKSSKFEVMLEMLEEVIAEGHRVLIFSQFTALLGLLKKELESRKIEFTYLDGKTSKRQAVVNEFKATSCPVFLMSLKAGGVGLNLVEADYVFLLDPWWNPAVESQAIDRVHRIGQKRPVNAYRFIAKNTVEEKILELQKAKRGLSEGILGQKSTPIRSLTAQDIENLLS